MGAAKSRLLKLQKTQPHCIYCGGIVPTTSCDHCPPVSIFEGADRPRGLEFGACYDCHQGTRELDLIAAMASRIFPDPTTDIGKADVRKHIHGFVNNHPDLAAMFITGDEPALDWQGRQAYPIDVHSQPRLHRALNAFSARIGLALFRELTGGAVPRDSVAIARWYSNFELENESTIESLLHSLGAPRTLAMGRKNVLEQFRYWGGAATDDSSQFVSFAAFRESFGTLTIIRTADGPEVDLEDTQNAFRPGFLNGFKV
ncbi:hypothetical protein [Devosia sp.]|uniref:hypothetical protein n=1 Tax=Devosia sp. TaxID=1871048 RepID=UPI003BAA3B93